MSDATRGELEKEREDTRAVKDQERREAERRRPDTEAEQGRVVYVKGEEAGPEGMDVTFSHAINDDWLKRKRVLEQFIGTVSKLIARQRCDYRIEKAKAAVLSKMSDSGSAAAALQRSNPPKEFKFSVHKVSQMSWLPVYKAGSFAGERKVVTVESQYPQFLHTARVASKTPFVYKLMEYQPVATPAVPSLLSVKPTIKRVGALEEQSMRGPAGEAKDILGEEAPQPSLLSTMDLGASIKLPTDTSIRGREGGDKPPEPLINTFLSNTSPLPTELTIPKQCLLAHPNKGLNAVRTDPRLTVHTTLIPDIETDYGFHLRPVMLESTIQHKFYIFEGCGFESSRPWAKETTISKVWRPQKEKVMDFDFEAFGIPAGTEALLSGFTPDDLRSIFTPHINQYDDQTFIFVFGLTLHRLTRSDHARAPTNVYYAFSRELRDDDKDEYEADELGFKALEPSLELAQSLFSSDEAAGLGNSGESSEAADPKVKDSKTAGKKGAEAKEPTANEGNRN